MGLLGVGRDADAPQRLEGTERSGSAQVWLRALSPGAEMRALCPVWMACHDQISQVSKDKGELALEEGWPEGQGSPGGLCGTK